MTDVNQTVAFEVRTEARGPHWIAWLTRGADATPVKSIIIVGRTRKDAEARARTWAAEASRDGYI